MVTKGQRAVHLSIKNFSGSVEHYYHFFMGFLVPLVHWYYSTEARRTYPRIYIRSCALLDSIVFEIDLKGVVVLNRELHKSLESEPEYEDNYLEHVVLEGYDHPTRYSKEVFDYVKSRVESLFFLKMERSVKKITQRKSEKILVINRSTPNYYYSSDKSEIRTAGTDRRSIPNFNEIIELLPKENTVSTTMEGKTLREQFLLFSNAKIVVAQHGAALANIIFCGADTRIVEIVPQDLPQSILVTNYFGELAKRLHLEYACVRQTSRHSNVDAREIANIVQKSLFSL